MGSHALIDDKVHPDLLPILSHLPELDEAPERISEARSEQVKMIAALNAMIPEKEKVKVSVREIPGTDKSPPVKVRIYEPRPETAFLPCVLYIHGGGYTKGSPELFESQCFDFVKNIGCVIVSVYYRLAPEHPFPAGLDDCYTALTWLAANAPELGADPNRLAVCGASAGGGLAAALTLLARERNGPAISFQMPLCPMLDDRCLTKSSNEIHDPRVWNAEANKTGWRLYLGDLKGDVPPLAAPAREADLTGLPPAYLMVGALDPFCDETAEYALRLRQAGVPAEFHMYPGCFHGFELFGPSGIGQRAIEQSGDMSRGVMKKN